MKFSPRRGIFPAVFAFPHNVTFTSRLWQRRTCYYPSGLNRSFKAECCKLTADSHKKGSNPQIDYAPWDLSQQNKSARKPCLKSRICFPKKIFNRERKTNPFRVLNCGGGLECLRQVFQQVVDVLQPDGQAHKVVPYAHLFPLLFGHRGVALRRRMACQRGYAAQ